MYGIRPGNGAGQFLQPQSPHGAIVEVATALGGSFKLVTLTPKTVKGDDSTAQGNIKGWGHTNKSKKHK